MKKALQQILALIKRHMIWLCRSPIRSTIRSVVTPGLVLAFVFYIFLNTEPPLRSGFISSLPYIIPISTFFQCYYQAECLVADKETGFRSLMFTMGLKRYSYFSAYAITTLAHILPVMIAFSICSVLYIFEETQAPKFVIVAIMIVYAFQLSGMILLVSSFITKTGLTIIIFIIMLLELIAHGAIVKFTKDLDVTTRRLALFATCLSPQESLKLLTESYDVCKNCDDSTTKDGMISQPTPLILSAMIFWTTSCYLFAIWLDGVCPWKDDEAPLSPLFCIEGTKTTHESEVSQESERLVYSKYFENSSTHRQVGIKVVDVTKTYNRIHVVKDVTFNIYKGETTLLLGHNGAGKTTLMNIILAKLIPDKGLVSIMQSKGGNMGYCPQTSILDANLDVRQHLELFSLIKLASQSSSDRDQDIAKTLHDICLNDHVEKVPSELSGGMKRKLSLGLAFVGQSSVMILDEPSSGLDPDSRLNMWNTIRRYRANRTVLLSTQHMEEADYLGDRIAIMSSGTIICCGSSIFLNELLGSGYKLRIECRASTKDKVVQLVKSTFDATELCKSEKSVANHSKDADRIEDLVFELKSSSKSRDYELCLIKLLEEIEKNSTAMKIISHSLKSSSIEDVMLNTEKEFLQKNQQTDSAVQVSLRAAHLDVLSSPVRRPSSSCFGRQVNFVKALLVKHFHVYRREWKSIILYRLLLTLLGAWSVTSDLLKSNHAQKQTLDFFNQVAILHFIYYPAVEKATKFKTIQLTTKTSFWTYWLSFLVIDILTIVYYIAAVLIILNYQTTELYYVAAKFQVFTVLGLLLFLFGLSAIVLAYVLSSFTSEAKDSIGMHLIVYIAGPILETIVLFIKLIDRKIDMTSATRVLLAIIYPTYSLRQAYSGLADCCYIRDMHLRCTSPSSLLDSSKFIFGLVSLCGQILVYGLILSLLELNYLNLTYYCSFRNIYRMIFKSASENQNHSMQNLDPDVLEETHKAEALVNNPNSELQSFIAADISKSYVYGIPVIDHLSFTVDKGECFGLLGINGAGKSTTFSMIAGESKPDSGKLWLCGNYSHNDITSYRHRLSYDPQTSPDVPLSPVEILTCMARLRQVDEAMIPKLVNSALETLNMVAHGNKAASELSGGTQRKLALAMALIGSAHLLALDEPTAGVDPLARRDIWQLLQALRAKRGCSILISSHAMEECEAICNRISIMAKGKLRCIGTFLHLRSKFARGCTIRVEYRRGIDSDLSFESFNSTIQELLKKLHSYLGSTVKLTDININNAVFSVTDNNVKRSVIFKILRDFKSSHSKFNYMLNDSSLEDIFIALAREQEEK